MNMTIIDGRGGEFIDLSEFSSPSQKKLQKNRHSVAADVLKVWSPYRREHIALRCLC